MPIQMPFFQRHNRKTHLQLARVPPSLICFNNTGSNLLFLPLLIRLRIASSSCCAAMPPSRLKDSPAMSYITRPHSYWPLFIKFQQSLYLWWCTLFFGGSPGGTLEEACKFYLACPCLYLSSVFNLYHNFFQIHFTSIECRMCQCSVNGRKVRVPEDCMQMTQFVVSFWFRFPWV